MADRFVKLKRTVDGLQRPVPMDQRTEASARRAGLRASQTLRPRESEPFRRRLGNCPSQRMSGGLKIVKPRVLLEKGAQIDSQSIREPQKRFPFLFAQLPPRHIVHP